LDCRYSCTEMTNVNSQRLWEDDLQHYLLHSAIHDKCNRNQIAICALRATANQGSPLQTSNAYVLPIHTYLQRVRVVGAEEETTIGNDLRHQQQNFDSSTAPNIVSVRGFPDFTLIRFLGERFQIGPDLLLGHLPYPPTFEVRSLPSYLSPTLHVLMISTGFFSGSKTHNMGTTEQIATDVRTEKHNQYLFENNNWGPEQCQKVNLHGPQFFSVEQKVTFIVHDKTGDHWSGIVLSNSGTEHSSSPWHFDAKATTARFLPLKQYGSFPSQPVASQYERNTWQNLSQRRPDPCLSRVHQGLTMSDEEQHLCLQDPRVFASDLLKTSALSWKLFLSLLHTQHPSLPGDSTSKADRLRRDSQVLHRARLYFRDAITFIERRNALEWPSCKSPKDKAAVELIMENLLVDFKDLDNEATSLAKACNDTISLEMNLISILDSKKSIEQAERVQKLTFLAYVFVPMSFITGIFGMNVKEINGSVPELSLFFAVTVPLAVCFALIPFWDKIKRWVVRAWLGLRHCFVGLRL